MNRVPRADWAAIVPWKGISGKPSWIGPDGPIVDMSAVQWAGIPANRIPVWNGTRFVPVVAPGSSGGGGSGQIKDGDAPAIAVRRNPIGQPNGPFEDVWARFECNVKTFGATGDGGTVDSDAFNNALYAIEAAGGGTLYIPPGTYVCPNLNQLGMNIKIRGGGIGVSVLEFGNGIGFDFIGDSETWFAAEGLSINTCSIAFMMESGNVQIREISAEVQSRGFELGALETLASGTIEGVFLFPVGTATAIEGNASNLNVSSLHALEYFGEWDRGVSLLAGTSNIFADSYFGQANYEGLYFGTSVANSRAHDLTFQNIAGTALYSDAGTNNYINEIFGIGGNSDTRFDNRKELLAVFNWSPGTVAPGHGYYDDFVAPGAALGDQVIYGAPLPLSEGALVRSEVRSSNLIRLTVMNLGTSLLNLDHGAWKMRVFN